MYKWFIILYLGRYPQIEWCCVDWNNWRLVALGSVTNVCWLGQAWRVTETLRFTHSVCLGMVDLIASSCTFKACSKSPFSFSTSVCNSFFFIGVWNKIHLCPLFINNKFSVYELLNSLYLSYFFRLFVFNTNQYDSAPQREWPVHRKKWFSYFCFSI